MKKIEIVKFNNGNFGIRRKDRFMFISWFEFLSKYSDNWFFKDDDIEQFCHFSSEEKAREYLKNYQIKIERKPDVGIPVDKL